MSEDAVDKLEALAHWSSTASPDSVDAAPAAVQPTGIEVFARESLMARQGEGPALAFASARPASWFEIDFLIWVN